jgi:GntR family transcriptional regulator
MDEVRRAIVLGTLRADEPLPSVRQRSADLRVNPNTVQQANRELEREGVVHVRRGQGTYVSARADAAPERAAMVAGVVERALRDAYRHGIAAAELIDALREAAAEEEHVTEGERR